LKNQSLSLALSWFITQKYLLCAIYISDWSINCTYMSSVNNNQPNSDPYKNISATKRLSSSQALPFFKQPSYCRPVWRERAWIFRTGGQGPIWQA
jgi:hypothetical protein